MSEEREFYDLEEIAGFCDLYGRLSEAVERVVEATRGGNIHYEGDPDLEYAKVVLHDFKERFPWNIRDILDKIVIGFTVDEDVDYLENAVMEYDRIGREMGVGDHPGFD